MIVVCELTWNRFIVPVWHRIEATCTLQFPDCLTIPISSGFSWFCLKIPNPNRYAIRTGKIPILMIRFSYFQMNSQDTYTRTLNTYSTKTDIQKTSKKLHTKYKIRLSTCTQNHVNIHVNKHETDNRFSKHFRQKLSSQNTRNGISEH